MAKKYLLFVLLFILLVFIFQNRWVAEIRFIFWSFEASLALIIFAALLAGVLLGGIGVILYQNRDKS
ncbi:MAG: DUF1049 domain-containing protein [Candidatus Omnitrophica bacterium]|nr:DUF1049 domain-containing protein [Candidatus Omnitrophota bacterium]MBD3269541.1 DUF1049 domain-containing protein [Candidatus Omnitrophota bacterium]